MSRAWKMYLSMGLLAGCGASSEVRNPQETEMAKPAEVIPPTPSKLVYPTTQKGDVVDDYHGTKVADPYRWLEDTDSAETKEWITQQNKVTDSFLGSIPQRETILKSLVELWNYERYSVPGERGGRYFFSKNDGLQNQGVLYWTPSLAEEPKMLLDPNTLSADGTIALAGMAVSKDGKKLAYGLASGGSDWNEWKVRAIDSAQDDADHLKWIKFSGAAWTPDNQGFYYGRYPEPKEGEALLDTNLNQSLYYHRLGTTQDVDQQIYARPDEPKWGMEPIVTDDGKYLVISVSKGTGPMNLVYFQDLTKTSAKNRKGQVKQLVAEFEAEYSFLDNRGSVFYFKTNLDAPRGRIIAIDVRKPEKKAWKEIVAQGEFTIDAASVVGDKIFVSTLQDAKTAVSVVDLNGKNQTQVELPGIGTAMGFGGDRDSKETFYSFTSYTVPTSVYRFDLATGKSELWKAPRVSFDGSQYETKQVFYQSKDGTKVPMFLTFKKGMKLDGNNPTLLYGYGGFNISLTPSFSPANAEWLKLGGVLAIANLRGGGEYGEEWHQGGIKGNKQNVFDDFIAAAEWLIENKYTSNKKLAIQGGSNGGLLVGAAITQRPDLFGAALPAVGVLDMLRFHKFTIGWAWIDDYGSSDNADEFATLIKYSPLHNLKAGTNYPATMITTGDHDDRVVPGHSFKFAAALQAAHAGAAPTLIRIETRAGHGAGKPTAMKIAEVADQWAFLTKTLGMN